MAVTIVRRRRRDDLASAVVDPDTGEVSGSSGMTLVRTSATEYTITLAEPPSGPISISVSVPPPVSAPGSGGGGGGGGGGVLAPVGLAAANRTQAMGAVTFSSQHPSGSYNAAKVFDGTSEFWAANGSAAENWVVLDLGAGVAATPVSWGIRLRSDGNYNRPKDFKLQGSNDGTTWTDLDVHDDDDASTLANAGDWLNWPFNAFYSYRYFRYLQTANWDGDNSANLTEFEVYGTYDTSISYGGVSGHPVAMLNNRNQQTISSLLGYDAVATATFVDSMTGGGNSPVQLVDGGTGGDIWGVGHQPTLTGWDTRWQSRTWAEFETWLASVGIPPWGDHSSVPSWIQ